MNNYASRVNPQSPLVHRRARFRFLFRGRLWAARNSWTRLGLTRGRKRANRCRMGLLRVTLSGVSAAGVTSTTLCVVLVIIAGTPFVYWF